MDSSSAGIDQNFTCVDCEQSERRLALCSTCRAYYCDGCWLRQPVHRPGRAAPNTHEKVDLGLYLRLWSTFNPDPRRQDELHREDEETTWFAVRRGDSTGTNQQKILHDSGRYASLVANGSEGKHLLRFPSIVSFVGQTGAGKSTLLKMLIERQFPWLADEMDKAACEEQFPTPVVGSFENSTVPTSGDVHLYADPSTYFAQCPMFFVDSEGLEGGQLSPVATRTREEDRAASRRMRTGRNRNRLTKTKRWRFSREVSRPIGWMDAPEKDKREFAVTHFYPRILYTFSDVIVFVLRNARTFESAVATRLIDWAAEVLNASTNQPRLPHAIIVLNAADARTNPKEWDVDHATESLLRSVNDSRPSARESERVAKLMKHWDLPEKPVRSLRDLLLCYYSSVRVVYVPDDKQYLRLEEQAGKLYHEIQSTCHASHSSKRQARMRMNADELDELFQAAFEHFSKTLDAPFDLVEAARKNTSIPRDFGGNVTKLAVAVRDVLQKKLSQEGRRGGGRADNNSGEPQVAVKDIFEPLSLMVASCYATDFFEKNYQQSCIKSLQVFYQQFWPCEYEFEGRRGRCVNTFERHQKGHQLRGRQRPGNYVTSCPVQDLLPLWHKWIYNWIAHFQTWLMKGTTRETPEEDLVPQIHQHNMHKFYEQVEGSLSYISHSICLCCLRELPEHPLQCGHVLCTACVKTYGDLEARLEAHSRTGVLKQYGQVSLSKCPLHSPNKKGFEVTEPRIITLKPDWAGVRLLCLDGGGVRGIVELEVLRHIENYLGGHLPIQAFFDLIVGTSTGGIIAAGLGVEDWRVDECIKHFMELSDKAFTRRRFVGIHDLPVLRRAGRKYRTKPFETILQDLFGEDEYLFGGFQADPKRYKTRVALTSTTATGSTAVVMANYNRPEDSPFTEFIRPDRPEDELKIWEAVRATTAAPGFFRPFTKKETGQGFVDGAVYHNNPAYVAFEESRLLWPDVRHCLPDIILSLGTGHNRERTNRVLTGASLSSSSRDTEPMRPPVLLRTTSGGKLKKVSEPDTHGYSEVYQNVKMILARMSNVLNSQLIWDTFKRERTLTTPRHELNSVLGRFQRIDPYLGYEPPALDDKAKMKQLKETVAQRLEYDSFYRRKVRHVAHRLVASSFYFEKLRHDNLGAGWYEFGGRILCRFPNNSDELSHLGAFLRSHRLRTIDGRGRPYLFFRVEEAGRPHSEIELTIEVLNRMAQGQLSIFDLEMVTYRVSNRNAEVTMSLAFWDSEAAKADVLPISGFPRKIVAENNLQASAAGTTNTPKVSADEYWRDMSTDVDTEPAPLNMKEVEGALPNTNMLGISEKEEENASFAERWASRRRALLGNLTIPNQGIGTATGTAMATATTSPAGTGASSSPGGLGSPSSARGIHRLFPSLASIRVHSRSPTGGGGGNHNGVSDDRDSKPGTPIERRTDGFLPLPSPPRREEDVPEPPPLATPSVTGDQPQQDYFQAQVEEEEEEEADEDEMQLNRAIQLSLDHRNNRFTAGGTNLVELQRALALSLLEGGYVPPQLEEDDHEEEEV
ncbi:hypothetical protein QBC46DRAFT_347432 [Diplogelasinospora grovesii]|uniref:PNPLA domain-containing protein n=1 Tax=Diplogelasinospora grovesii TaxID=303347 RepID=A0AAN6RZL9_9PEZI|nr:hypothetical protein QBC46DRAFT_347432 [Diplogelasinospora grovesii]